MEINPTFVDIFQIGPKWWTDRQIDTAIPRATLPAWLKKREGRKEGRKKKNDRHTRDSQTSSQSVSIHLTTFKAGGLSVRQVQTDKDVDQAAHRNRQRSINAEGPKIPSQCGVLPSPSSALRHGPVCFSCSLPPSYHHMDRAAYTPVYLIKHNLDVLLFFPSSLNTRCTYLVMFKSFLCYLCGFGRTVNSWQRGVILLNGVPSPQMDSSPHSIQIT